MKPPTLRSNPKLVEHSHEGESKDFNIPQIITNNYITEIETKLLQNRFLLHEQSTSEFKVQLKINDNLAIIHDIMMKPVHDTIIHILKCNT